MAVSRFNLEQAAELEDLLAEEEVSDEARERLAAMVETLRSGRIFEELVPPNIRIDEPIPGHHKKADEARAASPTGDLPRTDISPAPAPEEILPPHEFARPVRVKRASVADLNPELGAEAQEGVLHEKAMVAAGARRFHPALPDVEKAMPYDDMRENL
jgi:hypothetical protein